MPFYDLRCKECGADTHAQADAAAGPVDFNTGQS